jgi:hypothetical protein
MTCGDDSMTTDSSDCLTDLLRYCTICVQVNGQGSSIVGETSFVNLRFLIGPKGKEGSDAPGDAPPAGCIGVMDQRLATAGWLTKEGRRRGKRMSRRRHLEEMCQDILLPGKGRETKGLLHGCAGRANESNIRWTGDGIR